MEPSALIGVLIVILNGIGLKMISDLKGDIGKEQDRRHAQFDALTPLLGGMQVDIAALKTTVAEHEKRIGRLEP